MKKIIAIVMCLMMAVNLVGCGNYVMFETQSEFKYAIIKLPNGEIVQGEVESWTDYGSERMQVKFKDGNTYMTYLQNVVLMIDVPEEVEK